MNRSSIEMAAVTLRGMVVRTPALRLRGLDELAGCELWLKAENLQHIGAFKARGALYAASRLSPEARGRGLITYSSGNHAQAVALAARHFGVRADIAMPVDAPAVKVDAVAALGAAIVFAGRTSTERQAAAREIQAKTGGCMIEPFDHPDTIAGQGTATLELLEDVAAQTDGGSLDALIVPVGGGGLIGGACLATLGTQVRVYSAEPVGCDAMRQSVAQGERVAVEPGPTIADGLKPTRVGVHNFAIAKERLAGCFVVDDMELGRALVTLLLRAKVLVEPSGAAALAVALRGDVQRELGARRDAGATGTLRIGVLLSGGNVAPELVGELLRQHS